MVILALALGIGANAAILRVVGGVLWRDALLIPTTGHLASHAFCGTLSGQCG
jgi:hypothetical protein